VDLAYRIKENLSIILQLSCTIKSQEMGQVTVIKRLFAPKIRRFWSEDELRRPMLYPVELRAHAVKPLKINKLEVFL